MKPEPMRWTKTPDGWTYGFAYFIAYPAPGQGGGGHVAYFAGQALCEPTTLAKAKGAAKRHRDEAHERSELIRRHGW